MIPKHPYNEMKCRVVGGRRICGSQYYGVKVSHQVEANTNTIILIQEQRPLAPHTTKMQNQT